MVVAPSVVSGTPQAVLLQIVGMSKRFNDTLAVDEVSLDIYRGEIFALLGGSGSGKSTLLRLLAGFETPSAGEVLLEGCALGQRPPYERPINMMFQSYALFPHMTVAQNIAFGLQQERLPKAEIQERVAEQLQLVQMEAYAQRKPHQLSGGQCQRVALARALAKRPQLLLLDEPMGALDKKLRTQMQRELMQIIQRVGVTCIMVTHDQEEAMTMADRLAVMHQGRIVQVGTPQEVYEAPVNRQVCEFIGSVNLFEGQLRECGEDHVILDCPHLEHPLYLSHGGLLPANAGTLTYALRPEKLHMSPVMPDLPLAGYNWTQGVVQDIAYLGGHSLYHLRLASGQMVQALVIHASRHQPLPKWGETRYLHWEADAGMVLTP